MLSVMTDSAGEFSWGYTLKNNAVTERMLEAAQDIWAGYVTHPFVLGLADGSLAVKSFNFICCRIMSICSIMRKCSHRAS